MTRIAPAKPRGLDLFRRLVFRWMKRSYGRALDPALVIGHHRPLLLGYSAIGLAHERYSRAVERPLKQLAMLRSAQLTGCEWCLDFGSWLARESGVTDEKLRELSLWRDSQLFSERERLVLEYVEAMTRTPVEVTDELFERLHAQFDERQIVELTMTIGLENLYSRTNWAWGIEGQGFAEGGYCVRPDSALVGASASR
jgi:AhpD family alkylhydroperoxidase